MTKFFVIKYHDLYLSANMAPEYSGNITNATRYAHPENALHRIETDKLNRDHKVYQVDFVLMEVK